MINRRRFISGAIVTAAAPRAAVAQQTVKIRVIGVLSPDQKVFSTTYQLEPLRQRLREAGWVEGVNLAIEARFAEGKADDLSALVGELLQRRVEVIVSVGTTAIRAARDATATTPIVMAGGGDPVATGLAATLARPGGNVTGVSLLGQELLPKGLEMLKQAAPAISRVDVLMNAANPGNARLFAPIDRAARSLGVIVHAVEVRDLTEIERAIPSTRADAFLLLADPMFLAHRRRIVELIESRRIPAIHILARDAVRLGALMSFGINFRDLWYAAGGYVDKILRGAKPGDLPIEQPARFLLDVNLKTAKALGLTIPPSLLLRADLVIE